MDTNLREQVLQRVRAEIIAGESSRNDVFCSHAGVCARRVVDTRA